MLLIEEYINLSFEYRQKHINLNIECIERGGNSTQFRGILAMYLDTTIPKGNKIQLCHACHNDKCSNPNHIYWGTASENTMDAINNGSRKSPWEYLVLKYGEEEAKHRKNSFKKGNKTGRLAKGIKKTKRGTVA